eukprot:NODE_200_length_1232_cov_203.590871_g166_i0.p1 GENE.NODE_200_length_1232_cov_203.590871_g166_i0~~NODE_200_length_1232_cov_203.590871_g166_i0.p1  ORF type:complete len:336 (-),score=81.09 NODE_200_length_1232_cov_203.590871_g166_i0:57-1064(-)
MVGAMALQARQASLMAGFPNETTVHALNRQCSSGLQSMMQIAASIRCGIIDIGIGAGAESMSSNPMGAMPSISMNALKQPHVTLSLMQMGHTSDYLATKFGIDRKTQDEFALNSNKKAMEAVKSGRFKAEIVPVTVTVKDKEGKEQTVTVHDDEGPRESTLEGLGKLKPAFGKGNPFPCEPRSTPGNSSQTSDGASACLLMKRSKAQELGLKPLATLRSFAVQGCPPEIMGIGPAVAIPVALKKAGLAVNDIDVFEINEAFASQAHYCVTELGINPSKVNPNGGAIALGHPLGNSGCRLAVTAIHELKRTRGRYGVVSMCIGTGMGAAAVFENEL